MAMGFSEAVGAVGNREYGMSLQRLQAASTAIECARSEPERQRALQKYQRLQAEFQKDTCDREVMRGLEEACASIGESLRPPKQKNKKKKKKRRGAFDMGSSSESSDTDAGAWVPPPPPPPAPPPPPPPPPPLEPALRAIVEALVDEVVAEEVPCVAEWWAVRTMASGVIADRAIERIVDLLLLTAVDKAACEQVDTLEEEFTQQAMELGERVLAAAQDEPLVEILDRRMGAPLRID